MEVYRFDEVIDVSKTTTCATCSTYHYVLPCAMDIEFGTYVQPAVGKTAYPLHKIKSILINNDSVVMKSKVGRSWFDIKFKKDIEDTKYLFELQLAGYIEDKKQIKIKMYERGANE